MKKSLTIQLKVFPSSSKRCIKLEDNGNLKVYLHSSPENNKANRELIKLISDKLGIPKSYISILKGKKSRNKVLKLESIAEKNLCDLID